MRFFATTLLLKCRTSIKRLFVYAFFMTLPLLTHASEQEIALSVWANEAIVATYTFDHKNFLSQQKTIAHYFTSDGWVNYSNALMASHLPEMVKKNAYYVSAVATNPPLIKQLDANRWQADMPLLVVYENPQYSQKQTLAVSIIFQRTDSSKAGVRGLAISSLQSKIIKPACRCDS